MALLTAVTLRGDQLLAAGQPAPAAPTRTITVDVASPQQTMRGWEVLGEARQERADYANFRDVALDKVVEAGINRIRLEVRAGAENPTDSFAVWQAAGYPASPDPRYAAWRAKRYETINDDGDANTINPAGYHFTEMDWAVDNIVTPLRARLAAKGESLYVNLNYVVGLPQVTSGAYYVHQQPAEYAEFVLAAFQHLQQRYGWVPNGMEIVLEPDNNLPIWTATLVGQVIAATGPKLAANGYQPDIIAASTVCMNSAVNHFDGMMAVGGVLPYLKELSYHRYCGVGLSSLQTIAARAGSVGIATSMLEWWDLNNSFQTLHEDLKFGRNGAWQQGAIVDLDSNRAVGTISTLDPESPGNVTFTNPTQFFRRYFEFVRMGAVRLDASSDSGETDPLAFRNRDGRFTVVVKATAGGEIRVAGLPAGTYGIVYTASTFNDPQEPNLVGTQPDQAIAAGQVLTTSIPAWGVITVYAKVAGSGEICGDLKDNNGNGQIDEGCSPLNPTAPGPPAQLHAAVASGRLTARWLAPIAGGGVTGYVLDAGLASGSTLVSLPLGAGTSATIPGVPDGAYFLRVRAVGPAGSSAPSNEVAVTAGRCSSPPRSPQGFAASTNGPMVSLWWRDDACEGGRLHLLVGSTSGSADVATVPIGEPGFVGAVPAGEYFVRLAAETDLGISAASNEVVLRPGGVCRPPAATVTLTGAIQGRTLSLHWSPLDVAAAAAEDATTPLSYVIEAGRSPGSSDLGTYPLGRTTTLSAPLPPGPVAVRVRAVSACGAGPASNELSVTVP